MPRIFDNIEHRLLPALNDEMGIAERSDFCVGYFNLRGWRRIDAQVEKWAGGPGRCCRLLVGMQSLPQDQLRAVVGPIDEADAIDQAKAIDLKKKLAREFRDQLTVGIPTAAAEAGLRRLAGQLASVMGADAGEEDE